MRAVRHRVDVRRVRAARAAAVLFDRFGAVQRQLLVRIERHQDGPCVGVDAVGAEPQTQILQEVGLVETGEHRVIGMPARRPARLGQRQRGGGVGGDRAIGVARGGRPRRLIDLHRHDRGVRCSALVVNPSGLAVARLARRGHRARTREGAFVVARATKAPPIVYPRQRSRISAPFHGNS